MPKSKKYTEEKILAFVMSMLIFVFFTQTYNTGVFYYDATHYWELSYSFLPNGNFSFKGFPQDYRGYVFPFLLFLLRSAGNTIGFSDLNSFYFFTPIIFSVLFAIVLPKFVEDLFKIKYISAYKIIAFNFIINFFWYGLIVYPLTDMWSFAGLILCVFLFSRMKNESSMLKLCLLSFFTGVVSYCAYNIRTVNIFSFALTGVYLLIFVFGKIRVSCKRINSAGGIIIALAFALGTLIAALPQIYINYYNYSTLTPLVITNQWGAKGDTNLYVQQLLWGLQMQRYETYVGDPSIYTYPAVRFLDQAGINLLSEINQADSPLLKYIGMFFNNILAFLGIYSRHLINLLDPRFPEVYIHDLFNSRAYLSVINFCIWFIAALSFKNNSKRETKLLSKDTLQLHIKATINSIIKNLTSDNCFVIVLVLIITLPSLAAIPGAPEIRFFMPVYMLAYLQVCFFTDYKKLLNYFLAKPIIVAFTFIISLAIFCAVTGNTMASLQHGTMLLD